MGNRPKPLDVGPAGRSVVTAEEDSPMHQTINRSRIRAIAALVVIAVALGACTSPAGTNAPGTGAPANPAPSAPAPTSGGYSY